MSKKTIPGFDLEEEKEDKQENEEAPEIPVETAKPMWLSDKIVDEDFEEM